MCGWHLRDNPVLMNLGLSAKLQKEALVNNKNLSPQRRLQFISSQCTLDVSHISRELKVCPEKFQW